MNTHTHPPADATPTAPTPSTESTESSPSPDGQTGSVGEGRDEGEPTSPKSRIPNSQSTEPTQQAKPSIHPDPPENSPSPGGEGRDEGELPDPKSNISEPPTSSTEPTQQAKPSNHPHQPEISPSPGGEGRDEGELPSPKSNIPPNHPHQPNAAPSPNGQTGTVPTPAELEAQGLYYPLPPWHPQYDPIQDGQFLQRHEARQQAKAQADRLAQAEAAKQKNLKRSQPLRDYQARAKANQAGTTTNATNSNSAHHQSPEIHQLYQQLALKPRFKIARLPVAQRDTINQLLRDQIPYRQIVTALNPQVPNLNKDNLLRWKRSGYLTWLKTQESRESYQANLQTILRLVKPGQHQQLLQAAQQIAVIQLTNLLSQLDPTQLQQTFQTDPTAYVKLLQTLPRLIQQPKPAKPTKATKAPKANKANPSKTDPDPQNFRCHHCGADQALSRSADPNTADLILPTDPAQPGEPPRPGLTEEELRIIEFESSLMGTPEQLGPNHKRRLKPETIAKMHQTLWKR